MVTSSYGGFMHPSRHLRTFRQPTVLEKGTTENRCVCNYPMKKKGGEDQLCNLTKTPSSSLRCSQEPLERQ